MMQRLVAVRRSRGLSQAELSKKTGGGVTQQVISKLETGQIRDPSHRIAVLLSRALRVDPQMVTEFHVHRPEKSS